MENSPLDLSKPVTKLRSVRPRMPPDTCVDTIFIRRTGPCGTQAGRPVGTTQDGTSDSDDAPGTDAAADGFVGCLSAGRLPRAVVSCGGRFERPGAGGGHSRRPFIGTAACPALDRLKADTNPMTAVLDFGDALRDEPVERIVAGLPALLQVKDRHELSAIVFLCLSAARDEDRPRFVETINATIAGTDDRALLLAIAYGVFAAGRTQPVPFRDRTLNALIGDVFGALKQRTAALGVPVAQGSPWYEFFTAYRLGGAASGKAP